MTKIFADERQYEAYHEEVAEMKEQGETNIPSFMQWFRQKRDKHKQQKQEQNREKVKELRKYINTRVWLKDKANKTEHNARVARIDEEIGEDETVVLLDEESQEYPINLNTAMKLFEEGKFNGEEIHVKTHEQKAKSTRKNTKKMKALKIYNDMPNAERAEVVKQFMEQLEMAEATANTYYQNIKSGRWKE